MLEILSMIAFCTFYGIDGTTKRYYIMMPRMNGRTALFKIMEQLQPHLIKE